MLPNFLKFIQYWLTSFNLYFSVFLRTTFSIVFYNVQHSVARTKVQGNPELSPKQGIREGGQRGQPAPGPQLKGAPKFAKGVPEM
jgi:hypothetical protein